MSLEPRVTRVEAGLESLTKDVSALTQIIREQGANVEKQLQQLSIEVTKASGPRRTDWSLIVSFVFLILALGSAVFYPLNQSTNNNKEEIKAIASSYTEHAKSDFHPVTGVLLKRLEEQAALHVINSDVVMKNHQDYDNRQFDALDKKLQTEYTLMNARIESQIAALDTKVQLEIRLLAGTSDSRINRLETITARQDGMDLMELRAWRNKAAGLTNSH